MRILYHHRTQAEDGQAVHIRALQQAFREEGHELREVGLVSRGEEREPASNAEPAAPSRWGAVTRLPRFARELAEYAYPAVARPRILRTARSWDPHFLYERYAFGNSAGISVARTLRKPLVLEVNSPMVLELERTRGLSFPKHARRVEQRIFQNADRVCVVTEVLRDMLIELGVDPARLLVTPNGVHPADFEQAGTAEARTRARAELGLAQLEAAGGEPVVLGFVGFYRPWHRLELVVDALARPELARAVLVLIGEGPAHDELVEHAAARGVRRRVHFAGPRPHGEIAGLLPAFDVALVPAINPYASPLKLFEYMAARLAVIAPDQPNLREVLEPRANALLVPPGDGEALAEALTLLVGDPDLRTRLGAAAARTIVERELTWRGNARRVVAAVEELLR